MRVERTKEGRYALIDCRDIVVMTMNRFNIESLHESITEALAIEPVVELPSNAPPVVPIIPRLLDRIVATTGGEEEKT